MNGKIELYYDMPHLEAYLKASGANYDESRLNGVLDEFMKEAVLHHVEEKKFIIMGTLNEYLENKEIFDGSREVFRMLPAISENLFFDTDMNTLKESCDYLVDKENPYLQNWQATGNRGEQRIFRTTADVCFEKEKEAKAELDGKDHPLIFLDFDGVLNTERYYAKLKAQDLPYKDKYGHLFDPESVTNLQKIIDATDARIVVSSSWRYMGLDNLQRMWYDRDLPGWIEGITPMHLDDDKLLETDLSKLDVITADMFCSSRGNEIKAYFNEVLGVGMDTQRYVILDDLKDVLPEQEEHFIRIDPIVGITEEDAEKAVEILKINQK